MGVSRGRFVKYLPTLHLFGPRGSRRGGRLGEDASVSFLADALLIVTEKADGRNAGMRSFA